MAGIGLWLHLTYFREIGEKHLTNNPNPAGEGSHTTNYNYQRRTMN
jgi:hypothetical protein